MDLMKEAKEWVYGRLMANHAGGGIEVSGDPSLAAGRFSLDRVYSL